MFLLFISFILHSLSPFSHVFEIEEFCSLLSSSPFFVDQVKKSVKKKLPEWIPPNKQSPVKKPSFTQESNIEKRHFFQCLINVCLPSLFSDEEKDQITHYIQHRYKSLIPPQKRHIAIIGAGPIGLLLAIELGLEGHQITLIEKRSSYTRNRFFPKFHDTSFSFFERFLPEHLGFKIKSHILIKDFEEWMEAVLKGIQKLNPFITRHLGNFKEAQYEKDGSILIYFDQKNNQKSLNVDCLFGCDGTKSSVREVAQKYGSYTQKTIHLRSYDTINSSVSLCRTQDISLLYGNIHSKVEVPHGFSVFHTFEVIKKPPIFHFSYKGTTLREGLNSKFNIIPLSLYAESKRNHFSYQHPSFVPRNKKRIYLIGESLSTFPLGNSFRQHTQLFYASLHSIKKNLKEGNWNELHHILQTQCLEKTATQYFSKKVEPQLRHFLKHNNWVKNKQLIREIEAPYFKEGYHTTKRKWIDTIFEGQLQPYFEYPEVLKKEYDKIDNSLNLLINISLIYEVINNNLTRLIKKLCEEENLHGLNYITYLTFQQILPRMGKTPFVIIQLLSFEECSFLHPYRIFIIQNTICGELYHRQFIKGYQERLSYLEKVYQDIQKKLQIHSRSQIEDPIYIFTLTHQNYNKQLNTNIDTYN